MIMSQDGKWPLQKIDSLYEVSMLQHRFQEFLNVLKS